MNKATWLCCTLLMLCATLTANNFITEDSITVQTVFCDDPTEVCFDLPLNQLPNFQITLDDQPYMGGFQGCNFDTIINYTYSTLFGQGNMGPYQLDSWEINGTVFSGQFNDIDELVAMMNGWDPDGNWSHTPNMMLITGGAASTNYSDMNVTALINNLPSIIGLNFGFNAMGTQLEFEMGSYEVIFNDMVNNCSDTVQVTIECLPPPQIATFFDTISATQDPHVFCIDTTELPGNVTQVFNACPDQSGTFVNFLIDEEALCIKYQGIKCDAEEMACIVVCDDLGFCDTTFMNIVVDDTFCASPVTEKISDTIFVAESMEFCLNTDELDGTQFTIHNACEDMSGNSVDFLINDVTLCVTATGVNIGTELACIVICDEFAVCDTTCIEITVEENPDPCAVEPPPTAIDDTSSTNMDEEVQILILENDTIPDCSPADFEIVEMPENGIAVKNTDGVSVDYIPIEGFCGLDSFTYELCNDVGCDTALVIVDVSCAAQGEIIIYPGFSPNGDNINETFTIENIENFPESELTVYNRWGNPVFTAMGYQNNWNGMYRSLMLPDGTYFYMLDLNDGQPVFKGFVELRR